LILDNELHAETAASRIPKIAEERGIHLREISESVCVKNVRGELKDILALKEYFFSLAEDNFKIIVLDALYRFLPKDSDENANGALREVYNQLDLYALHLGCAFVCIHHSTKGVQSDKAIVDVGAGGGAQSRAADCHLILRDHEENDAVVLDAAVRSWPPIAPACLRWRFPVWSLAPDLSPFDLRRPERRRGGNRTPNSPTAEKQTWSVERFVSEFITPEPLRFAALTARAQASSPELSQRQIKIYVEAAVSNGLAFKWHDAMDRRTLSYASVPQQELELYKTRTEPVPPNAT